MATVAEQLVRTLRDAGVERIYGIVGDSLNPIVDAVRRLDGIEWVHVRHEEAAAFAAAAEAQVTGKLTVCAGSCGPGNLHLINGLYDAHRSGAPVLAIASHIPSTQIGTGFFQETHPAELFRECSHYSELVSGPEQLPRLLGIAMQTAVGQRGVSVLSIPGDVADRRAVGEVPVTLVPPSPVVPPAPVVEKLASLLNEADKVMLFAGAGTAGAHDEVMSFAAALASPLGHSLGGKEWIQYDNPYDVGRRTPLVLGVHGSVRETIAAVLPLLRQRVDRSFLDRTLVRHARKLEKVVEAYTSGVRSGRRSTRSTRRPLWTAGWATCGRRGT
jgi:pyruvate dehydrogenase (quinone)